VPSEVAPAFRFHAQTTSQRCPRQLPASSSTRQTQQYAHPFLFDQTIQLWRLQRNARIARIISTTSVFREGTQTSVLLHVRKELTLCRKTGITLADKGVYDEHGLEPISGIFSSPERSPPKRGGNATGSESMEIQESMF